MFPLLFLLLAAPSGALPPESADPSSPRQEAVIWRLPGPDAGEIRGLQSPDGAIHPVQTLPTGELLTILPAVEAADSLTLRVAPTDPPRVGGAVQWREAEGTLTAVVDGQDLFGFNFGTVAPPRAGIDPIYARSGYIDPIRTRSGIAITEAFPRLPERHEHQYALWSAWTAAEFEDRALNFWSSAQGTTVIRCEGVSGQWEGPLAGGITGVNTFFDRTVSPEKPVLTETWTITAYNLPAPLDYGLFDVSLQQTCAGPQPVTIREFAYGGFAVRLLEAFRGEEVTRFMTSTGETDRGAANATRQNWTYLGGVLDGKQVGLAILVHPVSFRAPQPIRLHPRDPYFVYAPAILGEWKITPEEPYEAHYRIVVLEGEPDRARLDRIWRAFAFAPRVGG